MESIKLRNGLNILFHQMLNTHSITIGLYMKAGPGYECEDKKGITHFLEHLHFRRSGSMSQEELYYKMESIGTDLQGRTYCDFLEYSMKILPDYIEEGLDILEKIVNADEWTDEEFEKERQVVINQIKEKGNYISMEDEIKKCVFRNSPISDGIMGTIDNINRLQVNDIKEYKKQIFTINNLIFCITGCVGNTEWNIIEKKLEQLNLKEGLKNPGIPIPKVFHRRKPDIIFAGTDDDFLEVNLSFDISGSQLNYESIDVLNCILGEGTGSNLQKRIRESLGYTSDIYSYVDKYSGFAVLNIRFSVEKGLLLNCLKEIVSVINNHKEKITLEDLDVSLPFYTSNKIFLEDDTAEMNFQLAYQNFVLGVQEKISDLKKDLETIHILQNLAQIIFKPENASVVIIGNIGRITKKSIRCIINDL